MAHRSKYVPIKKHSDLPKGKLEQLRQKFEDGKETDSGSSVTSPTSSTSSSSKLRRWSGDAGISTRRKSVDFLSPENEKPPEFGLYFGRERSNEKKNERERKVQNRKSWDVLGSKERSDQFSNLISKPYKLTGTAKSNLEQPEFKRVNLKKTTENRSDLHEKSWNVLGLKDKPSILETAKTGTNRELTPYSLSNGRISDKSFPSSRSSDSITTKEIVNKYSSKDKSQGQKNKELISPKNNFAVVKKKWDIDKNWEILKPGKGYKDTLSLELGLSFKPKINTSNGDGSHKSPTDWRRREVLCRNYKRKDDPDTPSDAESSSTSESSASSPAKTPWSPSDREVSVFSPNSTISKIIKAKLEKDNVRPRRKSESSIIATLASPIEKEPADVNIVKRRTQLFENVEDSETAEVEVTRKGSKDVKPQVPSKPQALVVSGQAGGPKPSPPQPNAKTHLRNGSDGRITGMRTSSPFLDEHVKNVASRDSPSIVISPSGSNGHHDSIIKDPDDFKLSTALDHNYERLPDMDEEEIRDTHSPERPSQLTTTHRYAKVNKKSQRKNRADNYDGVILLPKSPSILKPPWPTKPLNDDTSAPPKPPRTFAHDEYMRAKDVPLKLSPITPPYEEIPYHRRLRESQIASDHESDGDVFEPPPLQKPQPPPRPYLPNAQELLNRSSSPSSFKSKSDNSSLDSTPTSPLRKTKGSSPLSSKKKKEKRPKSIVSIGNPNYEQQQDVIEIKSVKKKWSPKRKGKDKNTPGQLRKFASDECLYSEPGFKGVIFPGRDHLTDDELDDEYDDAFIPLDYDGYAIPETTLQRKQRLTKSLEAGSSPKGKRKSVPIKDRFKRIFQDPKSQAEQSKNNKKAVQVKEKVNLAFGILRRQIKHGVSPGGPPVSALDGQSEDSGSAESESIVDPNELKKRLKHVASVKEKSTYATLDRFQSMRNKVYPQLYEYALVIGLKMKEDMTGYEPYILNRIPQEITEVNVTIPQFCFPDVATLKPVNSYDSEGFSFVLTNIDGTRQYGYCRRMLPPGRGPRLPEVYCIMSPLAAHMFYEQVLDEVEERQNLFSEHAYSFLLTAYSRPLPSPGKSIRIRMKTASDDYDVISLTRPTDTRLEHVNFDCLLSYLDIDTVLKVFASIMLERRIIFASAKLNTLSSVVHAISALLYPFTWQHTFIPVLPNCLLDICCSPTPYIIGMLSSCLPRLEELPMEEVLIVDLDNNKLLECMGDESTIIPKKLQKALAMALHMCKEDDAAVSKNLLISEAFLRLFVETVGHFGDHITVQQDGQKIFMKDAFVKEVLSKSIRMFLEWFTESQMFEVFITEYLEDQNHKLGLFEARIREYQEEMAEIGPSLKDNVKILGRKVRKFFQVKE